MNDDLLSKLDDTLVDLRAMITIVLYTSEAGPSDEFLRLKGELNSMFYMMMDKVEACERVSETMLASKRAAEMHAEAHRPQ